MNKELRIKVGKRNNSINYGLHGETRLLLNGSNGRELLTFVWQ